MALRLLKASSSSFPHLQGVSLQSKWYKDEAIHAKCDTNLRRNSKFALPRKDCSSDTLVGASAFTLSFVGEIPSAEIVVPRYTTWSSMKWNLLGFNLSQHSCGPCNTRWRFSRWISFVSPDNNTSPLQTQQPGKPSKNIFDCVVYFLLSGVSSS